MSRDDDIDELIKDVAVKHGVALGHDDPILMLHTINRRLIIQGKEAHQEILAGFKAELEEVAHRWSEESKNKAERVLNASLAASKDSMAAGIREGSRIASDELKKVVAESERSITKVVDGVRKASIINLVASLLALIAVVVILVIKK